MHSAVGSIIVVLSGKRNREQVGKQCSYQKDF